MRVASKITLTEEEHATLLRWQRSRTAPARLVLRAKIILLAVQGAQSKEIAETLGVDPTTVGRWRSRFRIHGLAGIENEAPGRGRKPTVRERMTEMILETTTKQLPENATRWSTRSLATELRVSHSLVHRVWRSHGLKPQSARAFKLSIDPDFVDRLVDVAGAYLNPPQHALALSVSERGKHLAPQCDEPGRPGIGARHSTATLLDAFEAAHCRLIDRTLWRRPRQQWLAFLKMVEQETPPDLAVHLMADNYADHKHPQVRAWLRRHPRIHTHFIPSDRSWLNLIKRWFQESGTRCINRGALPSLSVLEAAIWKFLTAPDDKLEPFVWTGAPQGAPRHMDGTSAGPSAPHSGAVIVPNPAAGTHASSSGICYMCGDARQNASAKQGQPEQGDGTAAVDEASQRCGPGTPGRGQEGFADPAAD